VINHGAEIANVDPPSALGAPDVAVRRLLRRLALPLIQILASHKRPHRKASFIRFIAGCWRFFTFTQLGETRERYGRSTWKMRIDLDESERQLPAATFMSFNKILNNGWHIAHLEIAAVPDF
jgi:hypothetical protein